MTSLPYTREVAKAVARARKGDGPTLVECKTYRHYGHFCGDPQTYKKKEEADEWLKKDPIPRFRKQLIQMEAFTQDEANAIDGEMKGRTRPGGEIRRGKPLPCARRSP